MFTACEALDLHDYNNFFSAPFTHPTQVHQPTVALQQRQFGGGRWDSATGAGNTVLLGYAGITTPLGSQSTIPIFRSFLDAGESQPVAWLKAHTRIAIGSVRHTRWLQANACAYDKQAYYFLSYKVPRISNYELPLPKPLEGLTRWRIPRDSWNLDRNDWEDTKSFEDIGGIRIQ